MTTYYDSAEDLMISRERALLELRRHHVTSEDVGLFFTELGDKSEYNAQAVLAWLGY